MFKIINDDSRHALSGLSEKSVNTCVTSPPYYSLRDYGVSGQIGIEDTPDLYVRELVSFFENVKRVLKDDGTLWVNIGDCYCGTGSKGKSKDPKYADGRNGQVVSRTSKIRGCKDKDMVGIPWKFALSMRDSGWYLRQDIIWAKPNPMPESVKDRCTRSHEYIFLFSKSPKYYFDHTAIKEPAVMGTKSSADGYRNKRDVWIVPTAHFSGGHFATYPEELIRPCVLAGCPEGGTVLDPFSGAGTTGLVAVQNGRNYIGIELNKEYADLSEKRILGGLEVRV